MSVKLVKVVVVGATEESKRSKALSTCTDIVSLNRVWFALIVGEVEVGTAVMGKSEGNKVMVLVLLYWISHALVVGDDTLSTEL